MFDLESFRWKNRVALVFGPTFYDTTVEQQRQSLEQHIDGADERDLIVGYIFEDGQSTLGDGAMMTADAAELRQRLGVVPGSFAFVLIGKDGGVKRHALEPVGFDDLSGQIDAMPMRQREIEENRER